MQGAEGFEALRDLGTGPRRVSRPRRPHHSLFGQGQGRKELEGPPRRREQYEKTHVGVLLPQTEAIFDGRDRVSSFPELG